MKLPYRRKKLDGTLDSICLTCLKTISPTRDDEHLTATEMDHRCLTGNLSVPVVLSEMA